MRVKFLPSFLLLAFISITGYAQHGFELSVEKQMLNKADSNSFVLFVDRAEEKDVIKSWENVVEKNKVKAVVNGNKLSIIGTIIPSISNKKTDIYSLFKKEYGGIKMYAAFFVDSVWVDPNIKNGATKNINALLGKFGHDLYKEVLTRELNDKESVLKQFNKDREKNLKEVDKLNKSVTKDSLNIDNTETEIILLKEQLNSANKAYADKKTSIAGTSFSDKDSEKQAKSVLKELDKNRKSIEKDIQKSSNSVLDSKSNIRDYLYKLIQLKEKREELDKNIEAHKLVVAAAEKELSEF